MKIIQITDTHLFANDDLEIVGVKSNLTCKEVIEKFCDEEGHNTDIIFLTGDISQDKTPESYQMMVRYLAKITIPIYWIPGNHDDLPLMTQVFEGVKNLHHQPYLTLGGWHFIFLNTTKENTDKGYISLSELQFLSDALQSAPKDKKIAIVMHHHPAPVGTPLVDHYILQNSNDFWRVIMNKSVALIICGHVHGDYQFMHNDIRIETSPATCLQWEAGATEMKMERKIGYKIYNFDHNTYTAIAKIW